MTDYEDIKLLPDGFKLEKVSGEYVASFDELSFSSASLAQALSDLIWALRNSGRMDA